MGFLISEYTRKELGEISLPGKAPSTLFWAIPVGIGERELNDWWFRFTDESGSDFAKYGLFLVKHNGDRRSYQQGGTSANLSGAAQSLSEFGTHHRKPPGFLILAGSYPQPGWGVFVETGDPWKFEECVHEALHSSVEFNDFEAIQSATRLFDERIRLAREPQFQEPMESPELKDLRCLVESLTWILEQDLECAQNELILRIKSVTNSAVWGLLSLDRPEHEGGLEEFERRLRNLKFRSDWTNAPLVREVENIVRGEGSGSGRKAKKLARVYEYYKTIEPSLDVVDVHQWVEEEKNGRLPLALTTAYGPLLTKARKRLELVEQEFKGKIAQVRKKFNEEALERRESRRQVERRYRLALVGAAEVQLRAGPRFLVALERILSREGFNATSIPWDPARMVGWKLQTLMPDILNADLVTAVNSVLGPSSMPHTVHKGYPSGSSFADFVYHVAIKSNNNAPWEITRKLLGEVLSPRDLRNLLPTPDMIPGANMEILTGKLLETWGWERLESRGTTPLCGCIGKTEPSAIQWILLKSIVESRTAVESFLKDVVRLCISKLGWREQELREEFRLHCPEFRWDSGKNWKTVERFLAPSGSMLLIRSLFPLAWPEVTGKLNIEDWVSSVTELIRSFNPYCHEDPPPPPGPEELYQFGSLTERIFRQFEEIAVEMPWHFTPEQIFGSQPCVAIGRAWSHSHPEERIIQVLLSAPPQIGKDLSVWNPGLGNPIMTDSVVISL